jgi:maltooligosyltrehalose trehalohydrolase
MKEPHEQRRLPIGAEPVASGGVDFRLWAPKRQSVEVIFEGQAAPSLKLAREKDGYFSGFSPEARTGHLYRVRLENAPHLYPDPASRYQPEGPHGPSQVVDPMTYKWGDGDWPGITPANQVLYELHIGTFTKEGMFAAAMGELPYLAELGVTCVEMMPVAEFQGRWGWGYDGVDLFAPFHHYGTSDDLRAFVDRAHGLKLGVILDVVYNHLGPDGNYLHEFSEAYFTSKHKNDWGASLNFDDKDSGPVREFFIANARHWIAEYHFDGFRFDATQAIIDSSPAHILSDICRAARSAAGGRSIYLITENEPQHSQIVRKPEEGGHGLDALWNDDFHHSARVALVGRREAYYTDYRASPQEFISSAKYGYLYQGQRYAWQKQRRGTPALDLSPTAFVNYIQNHDQVANSARGLRAHQVSQPGDYKAMTALLLLLPQTPLLFQGQEFAASTTFHYFADHNAELNKLICRGRARELAQFPSIATPQVQACLLDPGSRETFDRSKLRLDERGRPFHAQMLAMHRDLLRLRRSEAVFRRVQRRGDLDGAVMGPEAFLLRFFAEKHEDDRLLLVNFGVDLTLEIAPEPLLAPPAGKRWAIQWSSENAEYGGCGTPALDTELEGWMILGHCATLLRPLPLERAIVETRHRKPGQE